MNIRVPNSFFATILISVCLFSYTTSFSLNFIMGKAPVVSGNAAISNFTMDTIKIEEKASHILLGKVENIESHWNENTGGICTCVKVHVEELLKGNIQSEYVLIKHKGGEVGDIGLWVSGEPHFTLGEKVRVFLKLEETGEFTVVDGFKGKVSLVSPASSGFSYSGIHWDRNDLPVSYYINEIGTSDVPGTTDEYQAVKASFQTWEDDPESFMDYTYMGPTTRGSESLDGYNVVSWQPFDGPGGTLAQTTYWYNPSTKLMTEFDIVFDEDETWSATGQPSKHDIQNVGTHEAGHTLMLDDLYDLADSEQTMYGYASLGETKKRTLEAGDRAGIRYIYPPLKPVYTITTNPSGLQMEVDGTIYTSPKSFEWVQGSSHTIYVASTQSGGANTRYVFVNWSDGDDQQHQITVGTSSVTITANYITQYRATIATQGLKAAYPAMVSFTQLEISETSFTSASWADWCDFGSTLTIDLHVEGRKGERWLTRNATSWTVSSAFTATVNYALQYQISMTFKTHDQALTLQPTQAQIVGGTPNNTLITPKSYSDIWLDNVTWTLKQVLWRSDNVVALDASSVNLTPKYMWTITCRVYLISFEDAFRNFKGSQLSENPSSFTLQFPNKTVSRRLNPSSIYYIQNGTTRWTSITWQGVEVAPPSAHFDATDGNPTINCRIYDFEVVVSDFLGFPVPGAHVSAALPNGRSVNTQTGLNGVAVIRMTPSGEIVVSISFLTQTVKASGDVSQTASVPLKVRMTFGLFSLVLLSVACFVVGVIVVLFKQRLTKRKRVQPIVFSAKEYVS